VRQNWVDAVGIGRLVLSYWDMPADTLAGRPLAANRICRTFSDCTTAPRNGIISGCYPLDPHYKRSDEHEDLKQAKAALRERLSVISPRPAGVFVDLPPLTIDGANVICYTPIDERHRHTGNCRHVARGVLQGAAAGLAICQYEGEDGFYLFGCDARWQTITDTLHQTLEEATEQAEYEYEGVSKTWISLRKDQVV
jgi:hypothetical protein